MRVLMATMKLDIGGAETHIVELSKALANRGIEVIVASNGGAYETELKEAGIRHIKVPFHSKNPVYLKKAYKQLKQIILENHIDVVHAHARIPAFLCGLLHNRYRFRFVTTAHWVFSTKFPYKLLTRWGDRSLAVSHDIKDYLMKNYGIHNENIRVTINGIDLEKFSSDTDYSQIAKEFNLDSVKTRIVYVSRMDVDRSLVAHKLIKITPDLVKEIPDLEIIIVGGGNDYEKVKSEADAINSSIGRNVLITTGSRTDINRFVASSHLFVGVSRAALEAMACEKPAIIAGNEGYIGVFDQSKLQVSIDTNFCCRGCEEPSSEKLKEDIFKVLKSSTEVQAQLGRYSREVVAKYYSIDTMADDAIKMYISIIKGSKINQVDISEFKDIDAYLITNPIRNPRGKIDIMISGYYGFHNSGDDSILKSMVESLINERPDLKIIALSNDPAETKEKYGIDAINRFNIFRIILALRKTRLFISGGGSLIQDVTSDKSLAYYLSVIKLAKRLGAKVMLYANGIGPITNPKNHKQICKTLNDVDLITLREPSSLDELRSFGVTNHNILVTADPAFNLTAASSEESALLVKRAGVPEGKKYCGISVRPWKYASKDMEYIIAMTADYIKSKYDIVPLFIPMQEHIDMPISQNIVELMNEKGYVLKGSPSPKQIMGVVGGAEFIIGMRLHILIYAATMGTPIIGLSYDPKVDAVLDYMGQSLTLPIENINPLSICRFVDKIIEKQNVIKEELSESSFIAREKALENTRLALKLLDISF